MPVSRAPASKGGVASADVGASGRTPESNDASTAPDGESDASGPLVEPPLPVPTSPAAPPAPV
jgi:hypothetical protein